MFPSANDDLSEFTGGSTQFTFPNAALKDVLEKLPEGTCVVMVHYLFLTIPLCAS